MGVSIDMMKVHVCGLCGYRVLTSRRLECKCKACDVPMLKLDITFEEWWVMNEEERDNYIRRFLTNKQIEILKSNPNFLPKEI